MYRLPLFLLIVLCLTIVATTGYRIGAFNIQTLGQKKINNATVMNYIYNILLRYDFVLVQEIVDTSLQTPIVILNGLNARDKNRYQMVSSPRLGSTSSKEQYAYFYRTQQSSTVKTTLLKTFVYDDQTNEYERPPFIGQFLIQQTLPSANVMVVDLKIYVIGIHIRPSKAFNETKMLRKVVDSLKTNDPVVIMGDLNSGGSYMSAAQVKQLKEIHLKDFVWHIQEPQYTNVVRKYTYDRILSRGKQFQDLFKPGTNRTYEFDKVFNIKDDWLKAVSDHFPVEIELNLPMNLDQSIG
ncbi:unnamed protein product [Didymodactylos carnosus]|uniref:Deoxyribonuclease n=2 Tax=Didymodactylos carnosus TaxID=1234261 RepID=A0A814UGE2_9BILA|nr:unnamed protein product [Didymodactylos carnosus]CAF3937060.1 unnamed protein product [Didymodactylos carnosus]